MTRLALSIAIMITVLLLGARRAEAQSSSCTISVRSVVFGSYNVFTATAVDSTGSITYRCTSAAVNIQISLSSGSNSTYSPRTMRRNGESLSYNLYRNAGRNAIWGDGAGGTSVYTRVNPPNHDVSVTIYGRIPASQDVSAGSYSDTVAATINF